MGIIELFIYLYIVSIFKKLLIVKKLPFVQYSGIELTKANNLHTTCLFLIPPRRLF